MNETNEVLKYNIKSVGKINETAFLINAESDLLIDLNDDWNVSSFIETSYGHYTFYT